MKLFTEALKFLENSDEFKNWKKQNPGVFLSSGFTILDQDYWKISYYHKKTDKITSFVVSSIIEIEPESEIFKKETTKVNELNLEDLKLNLDKTLEIAKKFQQEKYKDEITNKTIIILQKLDIGQIWNITCLTLKLNTLNLKIDTKTGKILEHKLSSILSFKQS